MDAPLREPCWTFTSTPSSSSHVPKHPSRCPPSRCLWGLCRACQAAVARRAGFLSLPNCQQSGAGCSRHSVCQTCCAEGRLAALLFCFRGTWSDFSVQSMTAASLFFCTPVCNDRSRRSQRGAGVPSRDVLRSHSQVSSLQHFLVIALLLL